MMSTITVPNPEPCETKGSNIGRDYHGAEILMAAGFDYDLDYSVNTDIELKKLAANTMLLPCVLIFSFTNTFMLHLVSMPCTFNSGMH